MIRLFLFLATISVFSLNAMEDTDGGTSDDTNGGSQTAPMDGDTRRVDGWVRRSFPQRVGDTAPVHLPSAGEVRMGGSLGQNGEVTGGLPVTTDQFLWFCQHVYTRVIDSQVVYRNNRWEFEGVVRISLHGERPQLEEAELDPQGNVVDETVVPPGYPND